MQMTLRVAAETYRKLEERERKTHLSKSAIVQLALNEFLEKDEAKKD